VQYKLKLGDKYKRNMVNSIKPNKAELEFLTLSYNRFYDLFDEIINEEFWEKDEWYRYSKIKDGFSVYVEVIQYEPISFVIEQIKKNRPPMESEIGSDVFRFIRNLIIHFPFYDSWNQVWINKSLANWNKEGQFIDRFLRNYAGKNEVKYRFWEEDKKLMTYLSIKFPKSYADNDKIYLKDLLNEKEGVKFSFILMKKILDTQVLK
jgi:hypothetical protein